MSDIQIENYKKGVERAVERWSAKLAKIGAKAKAPREELAALRKKSPPSPADKQRIAELERELEKLEAEVDKANTELKLDVMLITPPPAKVPQDQLKNLPDWMKKLIKAKGIPLGNGVVLTPDVEFDWKTLKPKKLGVTIKW